MILKKAILNKTKTILLIILLFLFTNNQFFVIEIKEKDIVLKEEILF